MLVDQLLKVESRSDADTDLLDSVIADLLDDLLTNVAYHAEPRSAASTSTRLGRETCERRRCEHT